MSNVQARGSESGGNTSPTATCIHARHDTPQGTRIQWEDEVSTGGILLRPVGEFHLAAPAVLTSNREDLVVRLGHLLDLPHHVAVAV